MMKYVVFVQFLSGLLLTTCSVIVMLLGAGIYSLMIVYCLGNLLAALLAFSIMTRRFCVPLVAFDLKFMKHNLLRGVPFFFPGFVLMLGYKSGVIFLSKIIGDSSVGVYGAANALVEKLTIIPDGICTAVFPALASLNKTSPSAAKELFKRFFLYLLIIGAAIVCVCVVLSIQIINLIYGSAYIGSVPILIGLSIWLCLNFFSLFLSWSLGAIHLEKKSAVVPFIVAPIIVLGNIVLTPVLHEMGIVASALFGELIAVVVLLIFVKKYF